VKVPPEFEDTKIIDTLVGFAPLNSHVEIANMFLGRSGDGGMVHEMSESLVMCSQLTKTLLQTRLRNSDGLVWDAC
jgi:hypothetical protein